MRMSMSLPMSVHLHTFRLLVLACPLDSTPPPPCVPSWPQLHPSQILTRWARSSDRRSVLCPCCSGSVGVEVRGGAGCSPDRRRSPLPLSSCPEGVPAACSTPPTGMSPNSGALEVNRAFATGMPNIRHSHVPNVEAFLSSSVSVCLRVLCARVGSGLLFRGLVPPPPLPLVHTT